MQASEDRLKGLDGEGPRHLGRGPALVDEGPDSGDDKRRDGQVGGRAFLHVEQTDLDRRAVEAGDGAPGVEPLVPEDTVGVERPPVHSTD
jgi:hypothetical protein